MVADRHHPCVQGIAALRIRTRRFSRKAVLQLRRHVVYKHWLTGEVMGEPSLTDWMDVDVSNPREVQEVMNHLDALTPQLEKDST